MPIYTGTGDEGETGLFGGGRVPKDHARVEATGAVDELNAVLGRALSVLEVETSRRRLGRIQADLFALGAYLSSVPRKDGEPHPHLPGLPGERVAEMETWIDEAIGETGSLEHFILPGGTRGAGELHVARTICRRAERRVVALAADHPVDDTVIRYLNRLSDLLFAQARLENHRAGEKDVVWRGREEDPPETAPSAG